MAIFILCYQLNPKHPDVESKEAQVTNAIKSFQNKQLAPTTYLVNIAHRDEAECAFHEIIDVNDKLFITQIHIPPFATQRDVKVWLRARQFFPV